MLGAGYRWYKIVTNHKPQTDHGADNDGSKTVYRHIFKRDRHGGDTDSSKGGPPATRTTHIHANAHQLVRLQTTFTASEAN